jgi:small basic protein (TIGR04137 family)
MSADPSLKMRDALTRHRNVLTRDERMQVLIENERFDETTDSPFGLPKVAHRKVQAAKKDKKEKVDAIDEVATDDTSAEA